jgi:hypothetical protein
MAKMPKLYCDGSGMIIGFLGKEIGLCDLKSCDDCKKEDEEKETD